jgi:HAD superfamily hydrolase (TIGR01493 family)
VIRMLTARQGLLFDWGDTLMRNFPEYSGAMVGWPRVARLPHAARTLAMLYPDWIIALATNAADSSEDQIRAALNRVGLEAMIDHVFCYRQLGVQKPDPAYFRAALKRLNLPPGSAIMVGDDFNVDVRGALQCGLRAVWLNEKSGQTHSGPGFTTVHSLAELPDALIRLA